MKIKIKREREKEARDSTGHPDTDQRKLKTF